MRGKWKGALIIILLVIFLTSGVYAERYIVKFNDNEIRAFSLEEKIIKRISDNLILVEGVGRDELNKREDIVYFEEDYKVRALEETPWNFEVVGINFSEIDEEFGQGVKIAVFDTGADFSLLDVESGYDFVNEDNDASDDEGHGTFVTQLLKAPGTNLPLRNTEVYAVKVLDENGEGYDSNIIQGLYWSIENDIDIVLMSFGGEDDSSFLREAIDLAYENGILLVAAVGNDGEEFIMYPARYESVIGAGSVNENLQKSGFSNYGQELELMAPGENILVTDGSQQHLADGTSFAVPHVGVVAAGIFSEIQDIGNEEVREILHESAIDLGSVGRDDEFGYGLVQYDSGVIALHKVDVPVHQWIAYQASFIWSTSEIIDNINSVDYSDVWDDADDSFLNNSGYEFGDNLLIGSGEEDKDTTDDSYSCSWFGYNGPACWHFWDPDNPEGGNYDDGILDYGSNYNRAQKLYDRAKSHYPSNKNKAYYWLGRVAHLITDLTVPAHVHNDQHVTNDDSFEDFMKNTNTPNYWGEYKPNYQHFEGSDYFGYQYNYENLDWWNNGVKSNPSNLFKLFWFTAQKTQNFASDDYDGNNHFAYENGALYCLGYSCSDYDYLWDFDNDYSSSLMVSDHDDLEDDDNGDWGDDLRKISEANIPHAMKATAGLYRLFWIETHDVEPCNNGWCCDLDLEITKEEGEQPTSFDDDYGCKFNDIMYFDFYCPGESPDYNVSETFIKSCDGVCQYCSSGFSDCANYPITHVYNSTSKCSSGVGAGKYSNGGEYLCQGFCDGGGNSGYADNCVYDLECDKDKDDDGFCELGYLIENVTIQCPYETGEFGTDCNDTNALVNLNSTEVCNGIDDNCNNETDENLYLSCGFEECLGNRTCNGGNWSNCSSQGNDAGICASCDSNGNITFNETQNTDCSDGLWCNGEEVCFEINTCINGTPIDCGINSISPIQTCINNPDNNPFTFDFFEGFNSICDEELNSCTNGTTDLIHTCNISECGAECEADLDCNDSLCSNLDGCYSGTYREYQDISNTCEFNCSCTKNECASYSEIVTDNDEDNYDIECDNDCDDNNLNIHPNADENICNGIDNDCDMLIDEDYIPIPTSCGVGECVSTGLLECINGEETDNCVPKNPSPEICDDDLDNDCDGKTDCDDKDCEESEYCPNLCTIHSPTNSSIYPERRIQFNISASEKLEKIEYIDFSDSRPRWKRLCKNCDEYGFERKRTKSFKEGEHEIVVRCIPYYDESETHEIEFFVDSKDPRISKTEPRRNKFTNGTFYVKFKEENPVNLSITFNPTIPLDLNNCSDDGRYKECYIDLNLTDFDGEEITYNFTITDIAGNSDSKTVKGIIVDTTLPVLNNDNEEPCQPDSFWCQGGGRNNKYIYFDFDITEKNFDEINYIDWNDKNPRERRLCSRLRYGVCEKRKTFRKGDHNLTITILDEAGNSVQRDIEFSVV